MPLPLTLHLDGRVVLLVGGGAVARRKAETLIEAAAPVRLVSPQIDSALRISLASSGAEIHERAFRTEDLDGAALAIAATSDDRVNAQVVSEARARGILACDASDARRGNVTMQAIVRVGELTFTVDTGGASPAFTSRVARELRDRFGEGYAAAARTLAQMRTYVKAVLPPAERGAVLRTLAEKPIERLATLNPAEAEHEVEDAIEHLRGIHDRVTPGSVICASRASRLAMIQARSIAAKLAQSGTATTILNVATTGDRSQDRPIADLGAENVFVAELEIALRERRADYAVHSCKDLPSELAPDMHIAAISKREDPRDAFCSERFADFWQLPPGARVGTSSARRKAQLATLRDDLSYVDIRGNVDTRLRKLGEGDFDAIVVAMAGLSRLGSAARFTVPFDVDQLVPAVAQGALAAETRAEDRELATRLREAVNDLPSELCVLAERAALRALRGGCQSPIGIHACLDGSTVHILG
ncbi:MAG: hydroxymethylbilane synthase, partial [Candidatus Eremiobacteraeota bacterium]|nr:hydroxymethylbilane synthase [Candidatus Eremiobacteraeota bacterium]